MRFSIVYDDNAVVLAASVSGGDAGDPVPGTGMVVSMCQMTCPRQSSAKSWSDC